MSNVAAGTPEMFSARRWQTSQPSRIDTDKNLTTIDLPPKEAGTALGIGLTNLGSSWIDDFLSNFVDVAPTQLVVAQVSPESPAAGLLSPGDVVVSINGIGGDGCMTAEAASNFIRSATTLKMQVIQKDVASMVTRERDSALAPTRWLAIGLIGLVVLGMFGGLLAGTMLPWLNLSEAKHEAMRLREQASASLVEGKKAQRALRLQEHSLTSQITKLQATAASNSAQANARLHLLLEQQANISAQRDEWHAKTRKRSQELKKLVGVLRDTTADRDALQRELEQVRRQVRAGQEANKALSIKLGEETNAKLRARAELREERARVRMIRGRLRERAAALTAEIYALEGSNGTQPLIVNADLSTAASPVALLPRLPRQRPVRRPLVSPGGTPALPSALVSDEILMLNLQPVAMMTGPRYLSFVQVPPEDVTSWLTGFNRPVKKVDRTLLLLFARTGKSLHQYRTVMLFLVEDSRACRETHQCHKGKQTGSDGNVSEFRAASFEGWSQRRNKVTDSATVSHNFGALYVLSRESPLTNGKRFPTLWGVGGQDIEIPLKDEEKLGWSASHRQGVYAMNASRLVDVRHGGWFPHGRTDRIVRTPIIDGHHPGCVEQRPEYAPVGQFDGKLSLARFQRRFYLFARANLKPLGGGRFVQVAVSKGDDPTSSWGAWQLISIEGYKSDGPGNIYLAVVKASPFDEDMMIGLFAVNLGRAATSSVAKGHLRKKETMRDRERRTAKHDKLVGPFSAANSGNTDGHSFIGLGLSCNGRDWSKLEEISPTTSNQGRMCLHSEDTR